MIETARLRLRRARIEDAADLFAVFADPRAMRYWDSLPHREIAETRGWLARLVAAPPGGSDDFVIERDGLRSARLVAGSSARSVSSCIRPLGPGARNRGAGGSDPACLRDPGGGSAGGRCRSAQRGRLRAARPVRLSRDRPGRPDRATRRGMVRQRLSGAAPFLRRARPFQNRDQVRGQASRAEMAGSPNFRAAAIRFTKTAMNRSQRQVLASGCPRACPASRGQRS